MVNKKHQIDLQDDDSTAESSDEKRTKNQCQHIIKGVNLNSIRKALKKYNLKDDCEKCLEQQQPPSTTNQSVQNDENKFSDDYYEYDKSLWLCLQCGSQLCGRARNQHALKHHETTRSDPHSLALNTTTLQIWCYICDKEIPSDSKPRLLECIEIIKVAHSTKSTQMTSPVTVDRKDTTALDNIDKMKPLLGNDSPTSIISATTTTTAVLTNNLNHHPQPLTAIPGMAKRVDPLIDSLPSVRGLTNLGNTCFFNAVLQCLAQTPFLVEVLKEAFESGEEFILPGGKLQLKDEELEFPPIKGKLDGLEGTNSLLIPLVETLEELQKGGFVYRPDKLFNRFTSKCPQFKGYDQHDSHECLRHLLESVRCEDLNRYKKVILSYLGYKGEKPENASTELKQKCKFYGGQATNRILRPEPVFRGFLVSTLQCQDCFHTSSCHESFLDLSLPVSVEKPQPPFRRKSSPETSPTATTASTGPSKHQLKKEKEKARRAARQNKRIAAQQNLISAGIITVGPDGVSVINKKDEELSNNSQSPLSSSSSEQSDADVEDNLVDDTPKLAVRESAGMVNRSVPPFYPPQLYDKNGNSELSSPINLEKRGDSPENPNKEDSNDDENDSGIATSPANTTMIEQETKGGFTRRNDVENNTTTNNVVLELGISEEGANLVMQRSRSQDSNGTRNDASSISYIPPPTLGLEKLSLDDRSEILAAKQEAKEKRVRTQSHSDWCTTIAPRYQCEDGECSIQSCLNNFTAVELMTGNNKVGCDECTKRINGENGKKIYTNATKQFLISSPPAVLILHLKRFQVGPRCMFKKLSKPVSFPMILDIAPFCGSKIKNLPNVNRKQKKLLYSLYGIVEHSGGMYGGHYIAYVKVRPKLSSDDPRWKFLPKGNKADLDKADEQLAKLQELKEKAEARERVRQLRISENDSDDSSSSSSSTSFSSTDRTQQQQPDETEGAVGGTIGDEPSELPSAPPGKWYYVSDSQVKQVSEESVLKAQAYLLFYERIY